LSDRSHAPLTHEHRITTDVAAEILELRRKYPLYGAVKLHDWLMQQRPGRPWPAPSSIGALLKRSGCIRSSRRRTPQCSGLQTARTVARAPNAVWTADFKGQLRLRDGKYCYPLTVLDLHSHYLLRCTGLENTSVAGARQVFVGLFREYGLPDVLRTDNGVPFAQPNALGRLGALAFWWVRLGIRPEHITPARPAENGAHERFHKTLKAATTRPTAPSSRAQQCRFDRFRREYNTERPHASLPAHLPPGKIYAPSARPYPPRLPTLTYASSADVRLVDSTGSIKWRTHHIFLSSNLARQYVALSPTDGDQVTIAYAALALGHFDLHTNRFVACPRWLG
jgi:transposase InsO family protein